VQKVEAEDPQTVPHNGLELTCPAAQATHLPLYGNLAGSTSSNFTHASRVSCSESLCENPKTANRVPTGGQDRAPAKLSGPTSGSIRASLKGQVPTGPTSHTVWRVDYMKALHLPLQW